MRKFMKNDGLNDYKAFQAAFSHTKKFIVALHVITEQHCQKPMMFHAGRIQYGIQSPWEKHFKDFNYSRDVTLFIHQLCLILIPWY